jgi:diguanylate cyclase (GGDEF)-like protein
VLPIFERTRDLFVPPELRTNEHDLARANRVVAFYFAMLFWVPSFSLVYFLVDGLRASLSVLSGGFFIIAGLISLRYQRSIVLASNILCGGAWCVYGMIATNTGGMHSPVIAWYLTLPVLSILLLDCRWGLLWSLASVAAISLFAFADSIGYLFRNELTPTTFATVDYLGIAMGLVCIYVLVAVLKDMEFAARDALARANIRLQLLASQDGLTGISNRRAFDMALQQHWNSHVRDQRPLSVALVDTDLFKQYNDSLGHLAGDDCLRLIAETIQAGIRDSQDLAARYGGEEFGIILTDTDEESAMRVVDKIRASVCAMEIPHPDSSVHNNITISIGVATMTPGRERVYSDLLHEADRALYRAKREGRNQTVHSDAILAPV